MGPKAVIDTNVLISALGWGGKPDAVLSLVREGRVELISSREQVEEFAAVLNRLPVFRHEEREETLAIVQGFAHVVRIPKSLHVIAADPSDDIILETALVGGADYIITGDRHLLALGAFRGVRIVTPAQFLRRSA